MSNTLHIFNPSHDEALAANNRNYYPSKIARHLASEWGALPMLWAHEGDAIFITDDAEIPAEAENFSVRFVRNNDLKTAFWEAIDHISTWGWDPLLCQQLRKMGAPERLLPQQTELETIRQLSSRQSTTHLLPLLRKALTQKGIQSIGQSVIAHSLTEAEQYALQHHTIIAKSLWSCSGRGVFQFTTTPSPSTLGRVKRLLREQGGIELEPLYERHQDFALEFDAQADGKVEFMGVSLFHTSENGGYAGNKIASQQVLKNELELQPFVFDCLVEACERILSNYLQGRYVGPLGIDMMLCTHNNKLLLHPCIELNLRRTMGYVSLLIAQQQLTKIPTFASQLFHL